MWLSNDAPYLPELDLKCVSAYGMKYLNEAVSNSTSATVAGLMNAVAIGCRNNEIVLSGGYDKNIGKLEVNIILEKNSTRKL